VVEHLAPKGANFPLERLPLPGTRRLNHANGLQANGDRISGKQIRRGKPGGNEGKKEKEEERATRPRPPGSVGNPSSHKEIC
jgi:hypothetical protein